jgi:hypothetical protein
VTLQELIDALTAQRDALFQGESVEVCMKIDDTVRHSIRVVYSTETDDIYLLGD